MNKDAARYVSTSDVMSDTPRDVPIDDDDNDDDWTVSTCDVVIAFANGVRVCIWSKIAIYTKRTVYCLTKCG